MFWVFLKNTLSVEKSFCLRKQTCVICSQRQYDDGTRDKFRISENTKARKFSDAVVYFKGEIYTHVSHLLDEAGVFAADLF